MVPSLQRLIEQRRKTLKDLDEGAEYRHLANLSMKLEEEYTEKVSEYVFNYFKIEQETFFESIFQGDDLEDE